MDTTTGDLAIVPGVGFNGSVINPATFSAVIRALEANGNAKVVAAPRILVDDNAAATLTSTSGQPIISTNASDTVATTSFGGYASAGTELTVTPHINEGDHLSLEYSVTLSSFDGEGSGGVPAPIQENTLTSDVTVPDGYAVIVGGLNRSDTSNTKSKIPILGDLPLLGHAFSQSSTSESQSTLFVFIRPMILRDDEFKDLKYMSTRDLQAAELPGHYPQSDPMLMN